MTKTALGRKSLVVLLGLTVAACDGASPDSPLPETSPEADEAEDTTDVQSALTTDIWLTRKELTFSYASMSAMNKIVVPPGQSFEAWTEASAPVDPSLVAFTRTGGTSTAFTTKIVAQNDNRSSTRKNAYITWTNNGSTFPTVYVVVYAQNEAGAGSTRIKYRLPDGSETSANVFAKAVALYDDTVPGGPPLGCSNANASRIRMTRVDGSGGLASSLIAVNMTTMRGGYITDIPQEITQTLQLTDVLPSGGSSFILGFVWKFPELSPPNSLFTLHQNRHTCPVPIFP